MICWGCGLLTVLCSLVLHGPDLHEHPRTDGPVFEGGL